MLKVANILAARRWAQFALGVALLALCGRALAFYPIGGFDTFDTLRFATWKFSDFDTNNDGIITPNEGRDVQIEGGPAGFTPAEIETIKKAFGTWEQVSTTYASFRVRGIFQDPTLPGSTLDSFDNVSSIYMQVTAADDTGEDVIPDPDDVILQDVAFPVLGVTLTLFTVDESLVVIEGQAITIPAGTIIDSDIVINAAGVRPITTTSPLADLQGVMTHELGHFLGLGHTALNNLRPQGGPLDRLLESPVLPYTAGDGIQRMIGVTPTMFPIAFVVQNEQSQRVDGAQDLAPDDISGISFLYPRGSQAGFFNVNQEARTETRAGSGLPSLPIVGGHVVAWADQDGNPDTPRIPVFGTISGLYEETKNPQLEGRFQLQSLWKQMEVFGSANIFRTPSYTFTISPLTGVYPDTDESYIRQEPTGILPPDIDSLHQDGISDDPRALEDYFPTSWASQVFEATENILDVSNHDAGTPMVWSYENNDLISEADGKNLATLLPNNRPMFGDPNDGCPLFVTDIPGGGGTGTGTGTGLISMGEHRLRAFRDNVLLHSAIGTALVNVYYFFAPDVTAFLLRHEFAFEAFRGVKLGIYWMMENTLFLAAATLLLCALPLLRRRRGWALVAAGAGLWLLLASVAPAQVAYQNAPDFIAGATDIVSGTVVSTEARWGIHGRIYTDVTLEISTTAKGTLEKANNTVTFSVIGGTKDGLAMKSSESPTFSNGEQLVVYLREYGASKFTVYGGLLGKVRVLSGAGGSKSVAAQPEFQKAIADKKAKSTNGKAAASSDGSVSLDDYLNYVRGVVQEQEKAGK